MQADFLESRQGPTAQQRGEGETACISDTVIVSDVEILERLEHACHGWSDQGSKALVTDVVRVHDEYLQRGHLAQHWGQGQKTRISDIVVREIELPQRRHRPFGEGVGEGDCGLISEQAITGRRREVEAGEGGQTTRRTVRSSIVSS